MSSDHQLSADNNSSSSAAALAKLQSLPKAARNLIAGGLAGMIAKSFVAPIDRIKILYQVTSAQFRLRDVPKVAYSIIEKEGWSALWKGNTATMIRVFPYSGIQFMVFDYCKTYYLLRDKKDERRGVEQGSNNRGEAAAAAAPTTYTDVAGKRRRISAARSSRRGSRSPSARSHFNATNRRYALHHGGGWCGCI